MGHAAAVMTLQPCEYVTCSSVLIAFLLMMQVVRHRDGRHHPSGAPQPQHRERCRRGGAAAAGALRGAFPEWNAVREGLCAEPAQDTGACKSIFQPSCGTRG